MPISVIDCVHKLCQSLISTCVNKTECMQTAWWLLEAITKQTKADLLASDMMITDEQQQRLDTWVKEHVQDKKPLAYILGSVPFCNTSILTKSPILIPRPETEEWTHTLSTALNPEQKLDILELCTGTGCIALALAKELPHASIVASDINQDAIVLAEKNKEHNNITNVTFLVSNLYESLAPDQKYDLIVANPPYISDEEWKTDVGPSVKLWEDQRALLADDDGMFIINKIIAQAPDFLKAEKITAPEVPDLVMEIGYQQGEAITFTLKKHGAHKVKILQDLHHQDRVAYAWFRNQ